VFNMQRMDLVRFGRGIRALRRRRGWRQVDLAVEAGVSQSVVSSIELGRGRHFLTETLERLAAALGADIDLRLRWNGEALDRLLDQDHASLVEAAALMLRAAGWDVRTEVSFWIRGERGSVDVLAWHPETSTVLVIEVKSVVPDVQATLFVLDRKGRLAREIAATIGWTATAAGRLLVVNDDRTSRRRVDQHRATFDAALPDRFTRVCQWLRAPAEGPTLRGVMFLSGTATGVPRHGVRRPRSQTRA
jgi:transcriptional regulator with XRE-family HTH domain